MIFDISSFNVSLFAVTVYDIYASISTPDRASGNQMQYLSHQARLQKLQLSDPDAFAGWRDYPVGVGNCDPLTTSARFQCDQLSRLSPYLFSEEIQVQLIDVREELGN